MIDEPISGLDDLLHDVTITDQNTGAPLTTGTVTMAYCARGTKTPLGGAAGASQALTHVANGQWKAVHDDTDILAALTAGAIVVNQRFDRVLFVTGRKASKLASCVRVVIRDESPVP